MGCNGRAGNIAKLKQVVSEIYKGEYASKLAESLQQVASK